MLFVDFLSQKLSLSLEFHVSFPNLLLPGEMVFLFGFLVDDVCEECFPQTHVFDTQTQFQFKHIRILIVHIVAVLVFLKILL